MTAPQMSERFSNSGNPPSLQAWKNVPRPSSLSTVSPSPTSAEYLRLSTTKRKENKNNRSNEMQTRPRLNISYKITDDQPWVESKQDRKTWNQNPTIQLGDRHQPLLPDFCLLILTSLGFTLASGAPLCPDPLEPYLLPSQLHYLKTSSALDDPLNSVVCVRLKPNTEMNQEMLKQHKGELRKKHFQISCKSKAALNIFTCQRGITTKKIYLDFNVSHFSGWSYNGSSN